MEKKGKPENKNNLNGFFLKTFFQGVTFLLFGVEFWHYFFMNSGIILGTIKVTFLPRNGFCGSKPRMAPVLLSVKGFNFLVRLSSLQSRTFIPCFKFSKAIRCAFEYSLWGCQTVSLVNVHWFPNNDVIVICDTALRYVTRANVPGLKPQAFRKNFFNDKLVLVCLACWGLSLGFIPNNIGKS